MLKGLLSWSNLTDSAGRRVSTYALKFEEGWIDWRGQILGMGAEGIWTFFMLISTFTTTLLGWVSDPQWLDSLSEGYHNLTETAFGIVNPLYIAVAAFVILMVYIMVDTAKSTSLKMTKQEINRITAGIVIMVIVAVMVANPFALLNEALSLAGALVEVITGDSQTKVAATTVDAMIRQPTLIVNYGGAVSEACAEQWSRSGSLSATSGCFDSGADTATFSTIMLALLALFVAITAMVFTVVSIWKFTLHLTVAVVGVIALPWVAATTIAKRRQFDGMGTVLALVGGHLLMAVITQILTVLGPTLVAKILSGWGQTDWAVVQMFLLALSWIALTALMLFVTRKKGALVRALRADASRTLNRYLGVPGARDYFGGSRNFNAFGGAQSRISSAASALTSNATRIVKGKAAEMLTKRAGKGVMEDLQPVQQVLNHALPPATSHIHVPAISASVPLRALTAGTGSGTVIDSEGNILPPSPKMLALPPAPGAVPLGTGDVPGSGGPGSALVRMGDALLDVSHGAPSVDAMRQALLSQQDRADDPLYGGRTHPLTRDEVVDVEVRHVLEDIAVIAPVTNVAVVVAAPAAGVEGKLSPTQNMERSERARDTRARSDLASLSGTDRDDMSSVQATTGTLRSAIDQYTEARYPRMSKVVRGATRSVNALRGGIATRGDVRATCVSPAISLHADSEVIREATLMRARAEGKSVVVSIDNNDAAYDIIVTSDSPNNTISLRVGVGFGDRIR